jgi:acyl-CoA dehydrogenase
VNDELKLLADTSAALFTEYQQQPAGEFTASWDERLWRALETLRRRAALVRVVLLAGAMESALRLTVRYAGERQQFGRPIGSFQAIQAQVAELAAEVAATRSGADAAIRRCADDGFADPRSWFALAARGAGLAATIAHQVHGAIGFTGEHPLRLATTRLWAWRDEAGSQAQWAADLGGHVLAGVDDSLWNTLTEGAPS